MTTALLIASDHWDGPPWPVPLLFVAFWVAVAVVAVVGFRRRPWDGRRAGEAVLAERYARGDIDADEYRARRDVLRGSK